jgi:hypothetical protein
MRAKEALEMPSVSETLRTAPRPERVLWLQRRETWAGDRKTNRIRLAAVGLFTVNELVNYHVLHVVDLRFHVASLLVVALWVLATALFAVLLREHILPRATSYVIVSTDVLLLTWLLFLGDGPRSPLVVLYFLVLALSAVRLDSAVCLFTAAAAALGYGAVLEFTKRQKPELLVPPYHAVIVALALLLMGIVMAHLVGRVLVLLTDALGQTHEPSAR